MSKKYLAELDLGSITKESCGNYYVVRSDTCAVVLQRAKGASTQVLGVIFPGLTVWSRPRSDDIVDAYRKFLWHRETQFYHDRPFVQLNRQSFASQEQLLKSGLIGRHEDGTLLFMLGEEAYYLTRVPTGRATRDSFMRQAPDVEGKMSYALIKTDAVRMDKDYRENLCPTGAVWYIGGRWFGGGTSTMPGSYPTDPYPDPNEYINKLGSWVLADLIIADGANNRSKLGYDVAVYKFMTGLKEAARRYTFNTFVNTLSTRPALTHRIYMPDYEATYVQEVPTMQPTAIMAKIEGLWYHLIGGLDGEQFEHKVRN